MATKCYSYLRFSTPEQAGGDSLRRQTKAAEKWAKENNCHLDDSLRMADLGKSAWKNEHIGKHGALGQFIRKVESGEIEKGSILIVESLDRLSRDKVKDALPFLLLIINAGIDVVTLADGKRYNSDNMTDMDLMLSIFILSRAHEESATKSTRVGAAWANKRALARGKDKVPMTLLAPAWLKVNKVSRTEGTFEKIPERVAIIKRIFTEALAGDGTEKIARRLNNEKVPGWGRTNQKKPTPDGNPKKWHKSYVTKILTNGAVYGLFQPTVIKSGVRVDDEHPIEDYYPEIIPKKAFLLTRKLMKERTVARGRTGKVSSLFTGLAKCGYCGGSMIHISKGPGTKGGEYLYCHNGKLHHGCQPAGIRYLPFQEAFMQSCIEIDLDAILQASDKAADILKARNHLLAIEAELAEVNQRIESLMGSVVNLTNDTMKKRFEADINALGDRLDQLQTEQEAGRVRLDSLQNFEKTMDRHFSELRSLKDSLDCEDETTRIRLRKQLRQSIAGVVERMICFGDGLREYAVAWRGGMAKTEEGSKVNFELIRYKDHIMNIVQPVPDIVLDEETTQKTTAEISNYISANTGRDKACIAVWFKGGFFRMYRWDKKEKVFVVDMEDSASQFKLGALTYTKGASVGA